MTEETKDVATPEQTETPEPENTAGTYIMVQFNAVDSVRYQYVTSKPEPNPLAVIAALGDIIRRLTTAVNLQQELAIMNKMDQAQQQAQQALAASLKCQNCQQPLDQATANKVLTGKVAFCPRCHQKIGG